LLSGLEPGRSVPAFPQHAVLLRRELLFPFGVGLGDFVAHVFCGFVSGSQRRQGSERYERRRDQGC
jgi:hypothetical protein